MQEPHVHADQPAKQSLRLAARELDLVAQALKEARSGFDGNAKSQWSSREEMQLQLARAGDVVLRLVKDAHPALLQEKQPWIKFATTGSAEWKVVYFVAPGSDGGVPEPAASFELFLELAMVMQEGRSQGDNIEVWRDAEANFVRRHLFLEAVATWLPNVVGLNCPRLVLPRWFIRLQPDSDTPSFDLISDWFDHEALRGRFSTEQVVASECARMCEALAAWARAQLENDCGVREPSVAGGSGSVEPEAEGVADETSDSLPERFRRAFALYKMAQQFDSNAVSVQRAYELLQSRADTRESLRLWSGDKPLTLETFRRYVSEVIRKRGGPRRRTAQRIQHG